MIKMTPQTGWSIRYDKDSKNVCLTTDQARCIYKKVEQEGIVNVETIKQEIEDEKLYKVNIDNEQKVNPYQNIIINEFDVENIITSNGTVAST